MYMKGVPKERARAQDTAGAGKNPEFRNQTGQEPENGFACFE